MKKKHISKKKIILVVCVFVVMMLPLTVVARYVLNRTTNFFTRTTEFYFNSNLLTEAKPTYNIDNWLGLEDYIININLTTKLNEHVRIDYDIDYEITYLYSSKIIATLSKTEGTVYAATNVDTFSITITPNTTLVVNDQVSVYVEVTVMEPFRKTIGATFVLTVGQEIIQYRVVDSVGSPFAELEVTNNEPQNVVVQVDFDPNVMVLDMTNINFMNSTTTSTDSNNFINSLTFPVNLFTSTRVRFFKRNPANNYTGNYGVISVTRL